MNLNQLQYLYSKTEQPAKARACCNRALGLYLGLVREHPAVPNYQRSLAATYESLARLQKASGETDAARHSLEEARRLRERLASRDAKDTDTNVQ
jgi:hypothetical protein